MIGHICARVPATRGRPEESRGGYEAVMMSGRSPDYLLGQSAGQAERLRARMFAPYTARFLQDTGISRS